VKAADGKYESPLGFIADYNRTGWSNGFGGDYFVNNFPNEGIGAESLPTSVTLLSLLTQSSPSVASRPSIIDLYLWLLCDRMAFLIRRKV
jgi:hypothetical protein